MDVSTDVSHQISRTTSEFAGGGGHRHSNLAGLGIFAAYEVDLWGRIRATRDAARLDAGASAEDLRAAAISLAAEIAGTWYRLIEQRGQLSLSAEQLETNEHYLEVITLRFRRGQASATDVLQQRQLVRANEGEQAQIAGAIAVLEHRLAVLVGEAPGALRVSAPSRLPALPPLPATGVPAELVRRRPDLRAAELRVRSADRRTYAAIADRFPRLSLTAGAEAGAEHLNGVFDDWLANLAANLASPVFDGGRRKAEVRRTRAAAAEALDAYGRVILTALREVEDALAREAHQHEYVASLDQQFELSARATEQIRQNYVRTGKDFTRYLTTLLAHQRLERSRLLAGFHRLTYRIDLYRALGGGWPLAQLGTGPAAEEDETPTQ